MPEIYAGVERVTAHAPATHRSVLRTHAFTIFCIATAAASFVIDAFLLPPSFGATDIYYFKDAGINFAEGLGLVSRFTFGNPTFEYHSYSQYPPVYPLLFGLFVKVFGASVLSNQVFNSTIALCTAVAAYFVFRPLLALSSSKAAAWLPFAVFALLVFIGYFHAEYDRPDSLGVALGLLALILVGKSKSMRADVAAGCACALALIISPFAGIWSSVAVAIVVVADAVLAQEPTRVPAHIGFIAAGAVLTLAAAASLIAIFLPGWFDAFAGVATGSKTQNETGGGYFVALLHGDYKAWASGIPWKHPEFLMTVGKLLMVQIPLLVAAIREARIGEGRFQGLGIVVLLAASPLSIVLSPYQLNYVGMTAALLLAGAACLAIRMAPRVRTGYATAIFAGLFLMGCTCLPLHLQQMVVRGGAHDSLIRARTYIALNRHTYQSSGKFIAVASQTYMLWRESGVRPLTLGYSGFDASDNRRVLSWIAAAYPGSGKPSEPQKPKWLSQEEYALDFQPQLPQPAKFLDLWTSHSSETWESAIYRRVDDAHR